MDPYGTPPLPSVILRIALFAILPPPLLSSSPSLAFPLPCPPSRQCCRRTRRAYGSGLRSVSMTGISRTKIPAKTSMAMTPRMTSQRNRSMSILMGHVRVAPKRKRGFWSIQYRTTQHKQEMGLGLMTVLWRQMKILGLFIFGGKCGEVKRQETWRGTRDKGINEQEDAKSISRGPACPFVALHGRCAFPPLSSLLSPPAFPSFFALYYQY